MIEQLINLIMNSLFGDTFGKDIDYKHEFITEKWIETEYNDRAAEYHKSESGAFVVKIKNGEGIEVVDSS